MHVLHYITKFAYPCIQGVGVGMRLSQRHDTQVAQNDMHLH